MFRNNSVKFLFLLLGALCAHDACAMQNGNNAEPRIGAHIMPVCLAPDRGVEINLLVKIPDYYRSLQPMSLIPDREFVPKTDHDDYHWSEILTVQTKPGLGLHAASLIEGVRAGIQSTAADVHVLEDKVTHYQNYDSALLRIAYTHNGRRELLYAQYFSGSADCSGFQYTVHCSGISEEEAMLKIYRFIRSQVEIGNLPLPVALQRAMVA